MTTTGKITLTGARDIPFNKLVLSQKNVRRIHNGQTIEQLAADIARRGLIQSLCVRPMLNDEGKETGMFEVPAGGRRYRALAGLVKAKRMTKTAPVPCVVRPAGSSISAEEDSLAENVHRESLHPLDQFRAFKGLIDAGQTEEDVAARFFTTPAIVKQRMKLASVSEVLLEAYAQDKLTLQHLMAFTVSPDQAAQEQVWEALQQQAYPAQPYTIRQMLTREHVPSSDKRARYVGAEAYEAAGGVMIRDLFSDHGEGWFKDPALLTQLAEGKLQAAAAAVIGEGWKWVEVALEFPYGNKSGLRRIYPAQVALTDEEQAASDALREEYDQLQHDHEGDSEYPEEVDARLGEIEAAIEAFDERAYSFPPEAIGIGGAFVSLSGNGEVLVERGYVRPEDVPAPQPVPPEAGEGEPRSSAEGSITRVELTIGEAPSAGAVPSAEPEEEGGDRPITDRHMMELTTFRTLALRDALSNDPDAAFVAVLHAMVLKVFYNPYGTESCLEIRTGVTSPDRSVEGLAGFGPATSILQRKETWANQLPRQPQALWDYLLGLDGDSRAGLFALCAGLSVNAMQMFNDRRPDAIAHANRVAELVGLDMAEHWEPTAANFFKKVTKARILSTVREAKGEHAAQLIADLKKDEMAREAERLVAGSGWLPQPLRTPGLERGALPLTEAPASPVGEASPAPAASEPADDASGSEELPAFLAGDGTAAAPAEVEREDLPEGAWNPGWDIDAFEEGPEPDAEARALAEADRHLDAAHYGIAAE